MKVSPGLQREQDKLPGLDSLQHRSQTLSQDQLYAFKLNLDFDPGARLVADLGCCSPSGDVRFSLQVSLQEKLGAAMPRPPFNDRRVDAWNQPPTRPREDSNGIHQIFASKISSVAEARQSLEFSPSFTPSKERQAIEGKTQEFLKKSQLETQRRLHQQMARRRISNHLAGLASHEQAEIRPVPVKSERVSPQADEVAEADSAHRPGEERGDRLRQGEPHAEHQGQVLEADRLRRGRPRGLHSRR